MSRPRSSERKGAAHVHRWPLDEWRPLLELVQGPARYPDGSTDETTRSLDVIADALAAPGGDTPEAA